MNSTRGLFFCFLVLLLACTENKKPQTPLGKWEIYEATRNGEVIESAVGGYFILDSLNKFTCNTPGLPNDVKYTFSESLMQLEGDTSKFYWSEVTDSLAKLDVSFRGYAFNFKLKNTLFHDN